MDGFNTPPPRGEWSWGEGDCGDFMSHHRECAKVKVYRRPREIDHRAHDVADQNADDGHRDHRAGRGLYLYAAGWPRHVADDDAVLERGLHGDARHHLRHHVRKQRHLGRRAPIAADPDWKVGIALLDLHPYAAAFQRQCEHAHVDAGDRHAGHGPARQHHVRHVGHHRLDAADLHGVDVVHHGAAVLAEEFLGLAHGGTLGTVDNRPLRASVKFCLYWPRLIACVTLFT